MTDQNPNILLITSDQHHYRALGFMNPEIRTPYLDQLAREGTVFGRAYCVNPTCTPTRASMITGLYPSQHGAWALGTKLPETVPTIGQYLSKAGYRTALVGKAHLQPLKGTGEFPSLESYPILQDLDYWRKFHGPFYGFEHVELARNHGDEAHVGQHYAIWMEEKGCKNWRDYFRPPTGNNPSQRYRWLIPETFHYDAWIAERTGVLLEEYKRRNEKFFLWASFFDPHPPYLVPEPWDTMYDPRTLSVPKVTPGEHERNPPHFRLTQQEKPDLSAWRESGHILFGLKSHLRKKEDLARDIAVYYGMISLMDKYIGSILARLAHLGLAENTLVVFTTDHGHFYGQHGLIAKGPFHYEDMIRVPLIVRLPGKVEARKESDALQSLVDFAPTFLRIAGIDVPRTMTGIDQSEVWFGRKSSARSYVLVENHMEPTTVHLKTYVDERYKITVYRNRHYGELFDLKEDPDEVRNLWDDPAYSKLRAELTQKLIFAEMEKEPMWMPRVAGA